MTDVERLIHESMTRSLYNEVMADDTDIPEEDLSLNTDTASESEEI